MNKVEHLEELEAQLAAIQAQIDEVKNADGEWPKFGDEVWTIGMEGSTVSSTFTGTPLWLYKLATGSLHRTEEEASAYRDWLTSPRTQARRLVEMCDGFYENGYYELKYIIDSHIHIQRDKGINGGLRFGSEDQAQAAIDKLGEKTIKLALGIEK